MLRKIIKNWKIDQFIVANRQCVFTNQRNNIVVHHLTPFHVIRERVLIELGLEIKNQTGEYSSEEIILIKDKFLEYHSQSQGVVLRKDIHELFHKLYSNKCTPEDFYEFQQRWKNGEFENSII